MPPSQIIRLAATPLLASKRFCLSFSGKSISDLRAFLERGDTTVAALLEELELRKAHRDAKGERERAASRSFRLELLRQVNAENKAIAREREAPHNSLEQLLQLNRDGALSPEQRSELNAFQSLEHIVRLLKARAAELSAS